MKTYPGSEIRNVAVVGHARSGKTTLIAALLHAAKMTAARGRVADGSAVTAYDEEDVARGTTMQNAVAFAEWQGVKINLVDTPGFHMFSHEAKAAMLPVEAALVLVNAQCGVEAVTERVWKYAEEANLPRIVVLNQMDSPRAGGGQGLSALMEDLHERWGRTCVPVQLPITGPEGFHGVVDLITMQAFFYETNGNGSGRIGEVPGHMLAAARAAHEALVELVAEGKDELMEEFFAEGTIPEQHLITALHEAIREDRIFPVLFTSGEANVATDHLLDFLKVYAPAASERAAVAVSGIEVMETVAANGHAAGLGASGGEAEHGNGEVSGYGSGMGNDKNDADIVLRPVADSEPVALFVFKTMSDPFTGRISFFKVVSGVVKTDSCVENYARKGQEKLSHLSVMQGRKAVEVTELHAGDLGAVAKLRDTFTGDTLGQKGAEIRVELPERPEPSMTYAIEPKTRADEDKLAGALHKIMEEDQLVRFFRDAETHEFLVAGSGQQHIEAIVSRLKRRYHTEVTLKAPKVPYRETIRGKAEAQGRHKKQSGGHGQYGDCKIRLEPLPRGTGFEFGNEIFGGSIPRQYVPAVEKGIVETALRGFLAGYPVVDFKATVYDGSYHEVDSNELSFKVAGRLAFKKAMEQAKPCLLEPIMKVEVEAPEEFAGALMGDLNGRRGRVQGMQARGKATVIAAEVPMAEMLSYGTTLTSITQGRGSFHMELKHYDVVPQLVAEKILATAKKPVEAEEE
ncbi:elongation factor G [Acidicapsa acidisoli]|uniref:elongation factor G n=1 Tax=Acidicapsa acidisoli TaxID=1615681 RepID=UPI0021DF7EDC|nr:elongation factor G [Acidicapsa acidisoli]